MLQINRNSGRKGYDGKFRRWGIIEEEFKSKFLSGILSELQTLQRTSDPKFSGLLQWCIDNTPNWIVAKPFALKIAKETADKLGYTKLLKEKENRAFRNDMQNAYGYDHDKLLFLAKWLNVKTCPYCNMHYTLYAEEYVTKRKIHKMAKFQFDHFYDKAEYPMLSMSLFNLVPSCASCNQGKSTDELSLDFHPYFTDIGENFKFEVKDPVPLLIGKDDEKLDLQIVPLHGVDLTKYKKKFHVEGVYQRHKDVAREVFARAYVDAYYGNWMNFAFLEDQKLAERISKGFYPSKDEIELRPMTKFQQDLWEQAKGILR